MSNQLHYAVVVGINHYPGITPLTKAIDDAVAFRQWLVTHGGVPAANIQFVAHEDNTPDPIHARPNRHDVNLAIKQVNQDVEKRIKDHEQLWDKTRLYFYVSGHGISPDGDEAALFTADAGPPDSWCENIACGLYARRYERSQHFREVVVFADCCRLWQEAELPPPPFNRRGEFGAVRSLLGFATQPGERSFEPVGVADGDEARSYFTRALLEGLEGAAAGDDGAITDESLARYVVPRVRNLTAAKRYPQIPQMKTDIANPIVFRPATAVRPARRRVTLVPPPGFSSNLEVLDHRHQVIGTRSAPGPWDFDLEDGFYMARTSAAHPAPLQNKGLFHVLGENSYVEL